MNELDDDITLTRELEEGLHNVSRHDRFAVTRRMGYVCKFFAGLVVGIVADREIGVSPAVTAAAEVVVIGHAVRRGMIVSAQRQQIHDAVMHHRNVLREATERATWNAPDEDACNAIVDLVHDAVTHVEARQMVADHFVHRPLLFTPHPYVSYGNYPEQEPLLPHAIEHSEPPDDGESDAAHDLCKDLEHHHRDVEERLRVRLLRSEADDDRRNRLRVDIIAAFSDSEHYMANENEDTRVDDTFQPVFCELHRHQTALAALYDRCMACDDLPSLRETHKSIEDEYHVYLGGEMIPDAVMLERLTDENQLLLLRRRMHPWIAEMDDTYREFGRHFQALSDLRSGVLGRRKAIVG